MEVSGAPAPAQDPVSPMTREEFTKMFGERVVIKKYSCIPKEAFVRKPKHVRKPHDPDGRCTKRIKLESYQFQPVPSIFDKFVSESGLMMDELHNMQRETAREGKLPQDIGAFDNPEGSRPEIDVAAVSGASLSIVGDQQEDIQMTNCDKTDESRLAMTNLATNRGEVESMEFQEKEGSDFWSGPGMQYCVTGAGVVAGLAAYLAMRHAR